MSAPKAGSARKNAAANASRQILGRDPAAAFEPRSKISGRFKRHYRQLVELRDTVLDRVRELHGEAQENQPEYLMQVGDAGTETFDRDYNLGMIASYQGQLYEIEDALRRIEEGRYGSCELTGKPIPAERLDAIPWTRFTLEAEQQLESSGTAPVRFQLPPRATPEPSESAEAPEPEESEETRSEE